MKTVFIVCLIAGFCGVIGTFTKGEEYQEQSPIFLDKLKKIAEKMEVFPIDFIARKGPLSHFRDNSPFPKIAVRLELTNENFRDFYDFCELALQATEEDVELSIKKIETASPKEQALLLTVIYVYSFPWSKEKPFVFSGNQDELKKYRERRDQTGEDVAFENLLPYRSWLGLNYHNFDTENRKITDEITHFKYKKIVERFIDNQQIAFPAMEVSPQIIQERNHSQLRECINNKLLNMKERRPYIDEKRPYYDLVNISSRKEKMELLKKNYPEEYKQLFSDIFFLEYIHDIYPLTAGSGPRSGNGSSTPKTVGQVAQQLLDSWEPLKRISKKEKNILPKEKELSPQLPPLPSLESLKIVP
jgi:hypothetical protein